MTGDRESVSVKRGDVRVETEIGGVVNGHIVVGIDGSESSCEALAWAAEYARMTGSVLEAVYAWLPPTVAFAVPLFVDLAPLERESKRLPRKIVEQVLGDDPDVDVIARTARGNAAEVLVKASKHAELLVVGSLGLGGLKGMMLGSVGHHCAAHSHCPVVIVHHEHKHARPPRRKGMAATPA